MPATMRLHSSGGHGLNATPRSRQVRSKTRASTKLHGRVLGGQATNGMGGSGGKRQPPANDTFAGGFVSIVGASKTKLGGLLLLLVFLKTPTPRPCNDRDALNLR